MKFDTFLIDPEKMLIPRRKIEIEQSTGVSPTAIYGVKISGGIVSLSMETWKRIELLAEILSAVDMTLGEKKLSEIWEWKNETGIAKKYS